MVLGSDGGDHHHPRGGCHVRRNAGRSSASFSRKRIRGPARLHLRGGLRVRHFWKSDPAQSDTARFSLCVVSISGVGGTAGVLLFGGTAVCGHGCRDIVAHLQRVGPLRIRGISPGNAGNGAAVFPSHPPADDTVSVRGGGRPPPGNRRPRANRKASGTGPPFGNGGTARGGRCARFQQLPYGDRRLY